MPPKQAPNKYQYRDVRELSFRDGVKIPTTKSVKKWEHDTPSIASLVDNGFYYTPTRKNPDQVTCFWCGKKENSIVGVQALGSHHLVTSPRCAYGLIQSNMEYYVAARDKEEFWRTLAEEERAPKSVTDPHCKASVNLRASTFKDLWKLDTHKKCTATSRDLAKAGLYYSPLDEDNDRVICMYCDCPLDHWDPEDDPLREHQANSYAYCHFLETLPSLSKAKRRESNGGEQSKVEMPDASLDEIDDSMSATPEPSTKKRASERGESSSPLNESVSKWPSPLPSPEPELHKESEFDAYDFSIEDIEDPDHGSIFDSGKNKIYLKKHRSRKPPPPPPESLQKKSARGSLMLQVQKSRESDESTNRSATLAHESGELLKSLYTSDSANGTVKLKRAKNDEPVDDSVDDIDIDMNEDTAPEVAHDTYVDLMEEVEQSTHSVDETSKFTISDDDSSYHEDEVKSKKSSVSNGKSKREPKTQKSKKRLSEGSDDSMDSDRFQQILASPGKKKKVKLNQANGGYKPKSDILDLSGQNIGDFNESNISYLEEQKQTQDDDKLLKKPVLSKDLSTKVKKSAFDDDDDDFDFFVLRTRKPKSPQRSEAQEQESNEKQLSSVNNSALADISASTDVELPSKGKSEEGGLDLKQAKRSNLSVEKPDNLTAREAPSDKSSSPELEHPVDENGKSKVSESRVEVDNKEKRDSIHEVVEAGVNEEGSHLDNGENDRLPHPKPSPSVETSAIQGSDDDQKSPLKDENYKNEDQASNFEDQNHDTENHNNTGDSGEVTREEYVDTRPDLDEEIANPEPKPSTTEEDTVVHDDAENYSDQGSDFSLSPSSYGEYVKDMRSMEDEFVDASAIQEPKSGTLMIAASSKANLLDQVDEEPAVPVGDADMILFDDQNVKSESWKANELKSVPQKNSSLLEVALRDSQEKSHSGTVETGTEHPVVEFDERRKEEMQTEAEANSIKESDEMAIDDEKSVDHETHETPEDVDMDNGANDESDTDRNKPEEASMDRSLDENESSSHTGEPSRDNEIQETPRKPDTNGSVGIPVLQIHGKDDLRPESSPSYNESPHNRTFIDESLSEHTEGDSRTQDQEPDLDKKPEEVLPDSFIESSTPQKTKPLENAVYQYHPRIDVSKLGNITEELKTLKDTIEYLAEVSAASCELHNDNEGLLTDFIAAMPEEEEMMTVKEWMQHNASTCGRTVRAIADRMIEAYAAEFDAFIKHVENLVTTD